MAENARDSKVIDCLVSYIVGEIGQQSSRTEGHHLLMFDGSGAFVVPVGPRGDQGDGP